MNLLSNAKEEDNLMRVKSKEIAQYTKSNREKEPYFEIIYPGGLSIWKRSRMKS